MRGMTESLGRDAQVESILRARRQDLGIDRHVRQGEGLARELHQSLRRDRSQDYGMER